MFKQGCGLIGRIWKYIINTYINCIKFIWWQFFPGTTQWVLDTLHSAKIKCCAGLFKAAVVMTKMVLYTFVFCSLILGCFWMSFVTYSLFYHYSMPTEYQRQELNFDMMGKTLVADVSLNWGFVDDGVPPPHDCIDLQNQKYMAFLELDLLETDSNFAIISLYSHVSIRSISGKVKTFNQRANLRHK